MPYEMNRSHSEDAALDLELDNLLNDEPETTGTCARPTMTHTPVVEEPEDREDPALDDKYEFELAPLLPDYKSASDAQLLYELATIPCVRNPITGKLFDYTEMREEVCSIQIELNDRGLVAPAFRPTRKSRPGAPTEQERILTRDRMIIDLHWLHSRSNHLKLRDRTYEAFLVEGEFDFHGAAAFACESWTTEVRVKKIMRLTQLEQLQLGVLVSKKVRELRESIHDAAADLESAFRAIEQTRRRGRAQDVRDLAQLWAAARYCGEKATQAAVAQMYGWMKGEPPLASQSISDKLKAMRKLVEKAEDSGKE